MDMNTRILQTVERAQEMEKNHLNLLKKRDSIALDIDSYLADCISIAKSINKQV